MSLDAKDALNPASSAYSLLKLEDADVPDGEATSRTSSLVDPGIGTAGVIGSVVNLSNAILGAGMLGLPYAFSESGWLLSFVLLAVSGCTSCFTLHLLAVCSQKVAPGQASFYMLAKQTMSTGLWIVELAVILNCFGLSISYLVVFGNLMPYVVGTPDSSFATSSYLWVTIGLVFVTPMAFAPTLDMLRFTSAVGMAGVVFLAAVVIYYFFVGHGCTDDADDLPHCGGEVADVEHDISVLGTVSIVTFAYTAHAQLLPVANEVKDYTQRKMDSIIFAAIGMCGGLYATVGYMGYEVFGDSVKDDILESYSGSVVVTIARIGISALVGVSYPLMGKPARDSIFSLLANYGGEKLQHAKQSTAMYIFITSTYLILTYIIAMAMVNLSSALGIILSLLGATCSTTIAYIIPTRVYVALFPEPHLKKHIAIVVGCIGCIMMPTCVVATFL